MLHALEFVIKRGHQQKQQHPLARFQAVTYAIPQVSLRQEAPCHRAAGTSMRCV